MINFSERSTLPEKMDDLSSPEEVVVQTLRELETINQELGGYHVILNVLNKLTWTNDPVKILDIGCGGGDTLRAIHRWALKKKKAVKLVGIDYNPFMIQYANRHSLGLPIAYGEMNVYDNAVLNIEPDVVTCSLFLHHFKHNDAVGLIKRMYDLTHHTVIINDLHRHPIAYYAIKVLTAIFSRSYMIRYDAPLSVARAFKQQDWIDMMEEAGITNYTLTWRWAWRWEVVITKTPKP